jgi:hypothetical protein
MPWGELIGGLLGLLGAIVGGTLLGQWLERRAQARRWRAFRTNLLGRLVRVLDEEHPYTLAYARSLLVDWLSRADYVPQEMTEELLGHAQAIIVRELYRMISTAHQRQDSRREERARELLIILGAEVEERPPRLARPVAQEEQISAKVED